VHLFVFDVTCTQAIGGAVSIVVGAFFYNSVFNTFGSLFQNAGATSVQDSRIAFSGTSLSNCSAVSFSDGSAAGSSSVYGGAVAVLHAPQVSLFRSGVLASWGDNFVVPTAPILTGFNFSLLILNSNFSLCWAVTNSASVPPGTANGGGGAVYAMSVALSNVSLHSSLFSSCSVTVAIGAVGTASNSSGGAVSLEVPVGNTSVLLSSTTFWNCSANGAGKYSPFTSVRGGGVAVFGTSALKVVNTRFQSCVVAGASVVGGVSGGAGLSAVFVLSATLLNTSFEFGQDFSGTSAGLLVLSSTSAPNQIAIDGCSFSSTRVSLNVTCVEAATGFNSVPCIRPGPAVSLLNSKISQLSSAESDFDIIGSSLVSLQQNVSATSSNSFIMCDSPQFAVFRTFSSHHTVYSCSPCPTLQISLTSNIVRFDVAMHLASIDECVRLPSATGCPFGIAHCTTFVNVSSGFWAKFLSSTSASNPLTDASRCPEGYCGCGDSPSCLLPPPLPNAPNTNPLCNGNRSGVLCGGCIPGFTQSLDGRTCISNEVCSHNLWWVWTLSILWWAVLGICIVVSSSGKTSGAFSCILFFFQMSSLASSVAASRSLSASKWALVVAQFETFFSLTSLSCWAPNMSAYGVTVAKLTGPCVVLFFAVASTRLLNAFKPRLLHRGLEIDVSYSGTLSVTLLFVFSNIASVVFTLATCTSDGVVFIDGNVECYDITWQILIGIIAILCFVVIAFAVALFRNYLPAQAHSAVCSAYREQVFYWGALTLGFRLLVSIVVLLVPLNYSNISAFVRMGLSGLMFGLLVYYQPYSAIHTFWIDLTCYLCLIAQFGLQTISLTRDVLATLQLPSLFDSVELCSAVFR
jgi:hypothetical protein